MTVAFFNRTQVIVVETIFAEATMVEKEKAIGQATNGFWKMNKQNY